MSVNQNQRWLALVCVFAVGLAALFDGREALAQPAPPASPANPAPWSRPQIEVPACTKPPHVDGILDDPCWQNAEHATEFFRNSSPVVEQTEAWICADSSHLYVAFHCVDSHPSAIKTSETQRNGNTGVDDYISVDLDSQNNKRSYSQFIVTARGTQNENLEGGTADNITWAGDWRAATHATKDGWDVEISIPFALLRYARGSRSFGLQLERKLARETSIEFWPDRPAVSQNNPVEYFGDLTNISPTFYRSQPIFLPYALASAGSGTSAKVGIDIKYPLTSGLTGLATIHPDFDTVEQNVTNINFSYTSHFVSDQRPFFAEGSGFFPYSDVFYAPTIGDIDAGLKVTGKENGTSLGALATTTSGSSFQHAAVLAVTHDLNPLSNVELDFAGNDQAGVPGGQVAKTQLLYGQHIGRDTWSVQGTHIFSWQDGHELGGQEYYQAFYNLPRGHPQFTYQYYGIAPDFVSELGFVPEVDFKGPTYSVEQFNTFDKGYLQHYDLFGTWTRLDHWDGGFYRDGLLASAYLRNRQGNGLYLGLNQGRHEDFRDHVNEYYLEWSDSSAFGGGNLDYQSGTQADQHYKWWSLFQSYGFTKKVIASITVNWQTLGPTVTTQTIFTPTYRLTSERSVGGRLVSQDGKTDIFLSFAQKVRAGSDIFVLFGDPNSPTTRGLVQVKVVSPF